MALQKANVGVTWCFAILICNQIGDWLHYACRPHSQNLKMFDKTIHEHNCKVTDVSGAGTLALCFESLLWKEFLTKLRFFMKRWIVFIINSLSSSCQGCLYFTTFSVSPRFHFFPPFCKHQQNFYHLPRCPTPVSLLTLVSLLVSPFGRPGPYIRALPV